MSMWVSLVQAIAQAFAKDREGVAVQYLVVGSVASLLQGCTFEPNDIDIVPKKPPKWLQPQRIRRKPFRSIQGQISRNIEIVGHQGSRKRKSANA